MERKASNHKKDKYLKNRIRTLQSSKAKWKEEALDLRKQLKKIANQQKKEVSCPKPFKKTGCQLKARQVKS